MNKVPPYYAVFIFDNECGLWPVQMTVGSYPEEPTPIQLRLEVSPTWKMQIPLNLKEARRLRTELNTAIKKSKPDYVQRN